MNSKQRRKDRRTWCFNIKMKVDSYDEYSAQWDWLVTQYGKKARSCGWRDRVIELELGECFITWQFRNKKKAVEFLLRWGKSGQL